MGRPERVVPKNEEVGYGRKDGERRSDQAKIGARAEFTLVNEHFKPIFNAV
jgi:hypothetical protein